MTSHRRSTSTTLLSELDRAMSEFQQEVEAVASSLKERSKATAMARTSSGGRKHPTAYIEQLTASVSVPRGCLFVGHINTDMDSVGGAVGAAELYGGRACLAQPPKDLNGEIMYACAYARSGEKPEWNSTDVECWSAHHQGRSIDGFGANASRLDTSLVYFEDVFDPQLSKVVMVDHSAPSQMVGCLKKRLIDDGCTDVLQGIIDHHALDENIYTKAPLFMDVRPWGSMSTIITHSFLRSALPIPVDVARLLLCAIMSDTVNLTSPTTTLADRYIVPLLCKFCGETDHNGLAKGLFKAKTAWFVTLTPFECVRADQKDFETEAKDGSNYKWGWATVEVNEPDKLLSKSKELLLELITLKQDKGFEFAFLSVVNLVEKNATLLLCGPRELSLAKQAFPTCSVSKAPMGDVNDNNMKVLLQIIDVDQTQMAVNLISRKKQFKPNIDIALNNGWLVPVSASSTGGETKEGTGALLERRMTLRTTTNKDTGGLQNIQRKYDVVEK